MARPFKPTAWLAAASMLASASAAAQTVKLQPENKATNAPGSYAGVKPGGEQLPAIAAKPGATPAAVTWPGFQMQPDGSSRVFLQTTAPVATQTQNSGKQVIVDLGACTIAGDTNALPLDTRFFNSPVTRITLRREKGRLRLVLSLRKPVTPSVTTERASSGFHFVYVDFPAGRYGGQSVVGAPPPMPDEPQSSRPAAQREPPSHLAGEVRARGKVDTSMDRELPPGMGEVKADGKAGSSTDKGKAGGKVEGSAGFKL
jgi:hypothetical protein